MERRQGGEGKPSPKTFERIEQSRVASLVQRIGEFCNLPQETMDKAKEVPVFRLEPQEVADALEMYFKGRPSIEQLQDEETKWAALHVYDATLAYVAASIENEMGVTLMLPGKGRMIFIKRGVPQDFEDAVLTHEILHLLGERFARDEEEINKPLHEAATELLTIAERLPNFSLQNLAQVLKVPEDDPTFALLTESHLFLLTSLLLATHKPGGTPITIQDLAKAYAEGSNTEDFLNRIKESIPEGMRDQREIRMMLHALKKGPNTMVEHPPDYL